MINDRDNTRNRKHLQCILEIDMTRVVIVSLDFDGIWTWTRCSNNNALKKCLGRHKSGNTEIITVQSFEFESSYVFGLLSQSILRVLKERFDADLISHCEPLCYKFKSLATLAQEWFWKT